MMWNDGNWGAGGWLAMTAMMLLFWAAVVIVVVWIVRAARGRPAPPAGQTHAAQTARADDVLAERFACGELDETEFRHARDVLHSSHRAG
jgi:putative membrane protein